MLKNKAQWLQQKRRKAAPTLTTYLNLLVQASMFPTIQDEDDYPDLSSIESIENPNTAFRESNNGGRPKGSIYEAKYSLEKRKVDATNMIAEEFLLARQSVQKGKRLQKGTYNDIHDRVVELFNLNNIRFKVDQKTIKKRMTRKSVTVTSLDHPSPITDMEPIILPFVKYRQEAGQPMKPSEGLNFANSLIQGSVVQECVWSCQKANGKL